MKAFIFKVILFTIPVCVMFAPPLAVFIISGEYLPISAVIERQRMDPSVLYMSRFTSDTDRPLKLLATITKNPDILVLGSSKTLTIKSDFFDNHSFYNAGYPANAAINVEDLSDYMLNLPVESNLKVILIDLSGFLTDSPGSPPVSTMKYEPLKLFLATGWRDIYKDYFAGRLPVDEFISASKQNNNIGLRAMLLTSGYRSDGSWQRGPAEIKKGIQNMPADISRVVSSINGDQISVPFYTPSLSSENIASLERFLAICKSRNIYVIGYFSPYPSEIYQAMESLQNASGTAFRKSPAILRDIFQKQNYDFYDLRDVSTIKSSDKEFYDFGHPSEKGSVRILTFLANKEPKLMSYLDVTTLKNKLATEPL